MRSAQALLDELNASDESPRIEAKLSKTETWQRLPDIEGGNTWVLRRV